MDNIFQSKEWEEFKLATGYQKSFRIEDILVLKKDLPFGYSMLYSPMVDQAQSQKLKAKSFSEEIDKIGKENNAIFYRLELNIPKSLSFPLSTLSLKKAFEEMQPEHTWVLDLSESEEELLAEMKQKCRYNIKIAEQNEIEIVSSTDVTAGAEFYKLYSLTGKRHGISHRAESYFSSLLEILGKSGYARVYTAYIKSKVESQKSKVPLASAIMVYSGSTAIYMFGSSSDEYKNLMAPYALHWRMIRDAKNEEFKYYDFFGVAPDDNPGHPWAGVTRFKKQFGGMQINTVGSHDLILKPIQYQLFKIAEKIRRKQ